MVSMILFFAFSLSLSACYFEPSADDQDTSGDGPRDYFTDQGFGNPLGYIQQPSAEFYNGVTYIAFQGPHEDAYVCAYDHEEERWTGPVKAGLSLMGKTPDPVDNDQVDNHGRPALVVDGGGYIHLVFGGHGGYGSLGKNLYGRPGKGKQTHVVSKRPEDITEWEVLDNISPFGTYDQIVKMDNGDIYLFYRHGSHKSDWVYQLSRDNGRTFEPEVPVLDCKMLADSNTHTAWYAQFTKGPGNTIMGIYVYHACAGIGHSTLRENVYYMQMNCADGTWENASGEKLTVPVTKEHADLKTRILDSGGVLCNPGICRYDQQGNPHILYRYNKKQYWYTRWLDGQWKTPVKVTQSSISGQFGDMIVQSPDEIDVLISGNIDGGGGEVCWWNSRNAGLTWTRGSCIMSSQTVRYCVSTLNRNYHPDAMFGLFEKDPASPHLYRKIFMWGAGGFVKRVD